MATSIERKWGSAAHWIPLAANFLSAGLLGWVAVLVLYLSKRQNSQFIGFHAYQSLFFQGILSVVMLVGWILTSVWIGRPILMVAGIIGLIVPIVAAVHASKGEWWRNPILGGRRRTLSS